MTTETTIQSEPLILALDTASRATSIALARGDRVIAMFGAETDERRSERLWTQIEFLLNEAGIGLSDIELFAVSAGPGGFTGLRVGMAAIKGFAFAANRPAIGVTSLESAAFAYAGAPLVLGLVNAYRGEVYSQLFSFDEEGAPVAENEPAVTSIAEAVSRVAEFDEVVFTGDAVAESFEIIRRVGGHRLQGGWTARGERRLVADYIARLALIKYHRGEAASPESLRACYVRKAEAEIKLSLGLLGTKIKRSMRSK